MNLRILSSIARPVDPRFATNRAIMAVMALVALGEFVLSILSGSGWLASMGAAGGYALTLFLAWALCRELDPDRDLSAFVAAALALAGTVYWGIPDLAGLFCILVAMRVVNRATGLSATILDSIVLLALASWLTIRGDWWFGAMTTIAFLADGVLVPYLRRNLVLAIVCLAATAVAVVFTGGSGLGEQPLLAASIAFVLCLFFAPVLLASGVLTTLADDTGEALQPARVRSGQAVALFCGLAAAFWAGTEGLASLLPLWCAAIGASACLIYQSLAVRTGTTSA